MSQKKSSITLTTDFGEADYFVPVMKGVIWSINPAAEVVDITHLIPAHDIYAAAFTLMCCYKYFPRNTIHVAVVDPGVGSARRPVMVMTDDCNFIGADNGVVSYIYERAQVKRVVHFAKEDYVQKPVSSTFTGCGVIARVLV